MFTNTTIYNKKIIFVFKAYHNSWLYLHQQSRNHVLHSNYLFKTVTVKHCVVSAGNRCYLVLFYTPGKVINPFIKYILLTHVHSQHFLA